MSNKQNVNVLNSADSADAQANNKGVLPVLLPRPQPLKHLPPKPLPPQFPRYTAALALTSATPTAVVDATKQANELTARAGDAAAVADVVAQDAVVMAEAHIRSRQATLDTLHKKMRELNFKESENALLLKLRDRKTSGEPMDKSTAGQLQLLEMRSQAFKELSVMINTFAREIEKQKADKQKAVAAATAMAVLAKEKKMEKMAAEKIVAEKKEKKAAAAAAEKAAAEKEKIAQIAAAADVALELEEREANMPALAPLVVEKQDEQEEDEQKEQEENEQKEDELPPAEEENDAFEVEEEKEKEEEEKTTVGRCRCGKISTDSVTDWTLCKKCTAWVSDTVAVLCHCNRSEPPVALVNDPDDDIEWITCEVCHVSSHQVCYPAYSALRDGPFCCCLCTPQGITRSAASAREQQHENNNAGGGEKNENGNGEENNRKETPFELDRLELDKRSVMMGDRFDSVRFDPAQDPAQQDESDSEEIRKEQQRGEKSNSSDTYFQCQHCVLRFATRSTLRFHHNTRHKGKQLLLVPVDKPVVFECVECNIVCKSNRGLSSHYYAKHYSPMESSSSESPLLSSTTMPERKKRSFASSSGGVDKAKETSNNSSKRIRGQRYVDHWLPSENEESFGETEEYEQAPPFFDEPQPPIVIEDDDGGIKGDMVVVESVAPAKAVVALSAQTPVSKAPPSAPKSETPAVSLDVLAARLCDDTRLDVALASMLPNKSPKLLAEWVEVLFDQDLDTVQELRFLPVPYFVALRKKIGVRGLFDYVLCALRGQDSEPL